MSEDVVFVNLDAVSGLRNILVLVMILVLVLDVVFVDLDAVSGLRNILVFSDKPPSSQASFPPFNSSSRVFQEFPLFIQTTTTSSG